MTLPAEGNEVMLGARLDGLRRSETTVSIPSRLLRSRRAADGPAVRADARRAPRRATVGLVALSYGLIGAVVVLDWMTPPGVAVAILLSIPFMLLSLLDDIRQLWIAGAVALTGRFADMFLGGVSSIPKEILVPNRVLITIGIISSIGIAHLLLRQRTWAQRARDAALDARDMNRLLVSLMAHDLRSPLVVANDALAYAERTAADRLPVDSMLLTDARVRLQRSLRTVESILILARGEITQSGTRQEAETRAPTSIRAAISSEIASFAAEAAQRGKPLLSHFDLADADPYIFDALVVRQSLAILIDNAIRYANPGPIHVEVFTSDREVLVRVADSGPGLSASRASAATRPSSGSGLGLELCRALIGHAGGRMELERDATTGTVFVLRLPAHRA
jgi:signal transduction histidine kinase